MTGRVVVLGSINIDLVCTTTTNPGPGETVRGTSLTRRPGGKGANQALAAARAGADVHLVGAVGDDHDGRSYERALREHGVETYLVAKFGLPTGHALVLVDQTAENSIVVVPGANGALSPVEARTALTGLRTGDVLMLQLELALPTVAAAARHARAAGATVVLNPSPWHPSVSTLLDDVDVLIVNEEEARALGSRPLGVEVVRTLGARGAALEGVSQVGADAVEAVDTTGAGDAFAGTFAAALAHGGDLEEALQQAVAAGSAACLHDGAQPWQL
jgi:ribokinase